MRAEYVWERQVVGVQSPRIAEPLQHRKCGWTEQVEDLGSIVVKREVDVGLRDASMTEGHSFAGKAISGFSCIDMALSIILC